MIDDRNLKLRKYIIIGIIILLVIGFFGLLFRDSDNSSNLKIDNNKEYVYSIASSYVKTTEVQSYYPYININSTDAEETNQYLEELYNNSQKEGNIQLTYGYSENDNYLSVAIFINTMYLDFSGAETAIETYNFDLETGQLVANDELLADFGYEWSRIASSFENEMKNYYQEEIEKEFMYEPECDYNCFLKVRGVSSYYDNLHLYVKDNRLMYYRPFLVYSPMGEEAFYQEKNEDFLFQIY